MRNCTFLFSIGLLLSAVAPRVAHADDDADKTKLCSQLTVSDELGGEDKQFMRARRQLFGCAMGQTKPFYADLGTGVDNELVTYLDNSETPADQFVILANVLAASRAGHDTDIPDFRLLNYVVDQVDYSLLNPADAMKELESAPYAGNAYARAVITKSIDAAKSSIAGIEAAIQKKASDADWKELLVTAPQRGIADWRTAAAAHKDALAHSDAFEHKLWGPSKKALAGCWEPLRKEFLDVARTLKHDNAAQFKEALSDPVASLLFRRLAACGAADTDSQYAQVLVVQTKDLRFERGPRYAAYYAALDALGKILEDRSKFPVALADFKRFQSGELYKASFDMAYDGKKGHGKTKGVGFVGDSGKGVVKSAKKTADGVQIDFVTEKHDEMGRECHDTNHLQTWRPDGSPMWQQACRDTGMITVKTSPEPVTIPAEWADGIKVGNYLEFDSMIGKPPGRIALPKVVYADKSKKKLVNWYGLGL